MDSHAIDGDNGSAILRERQHFTSHHALAVIPLARHSLTSASRSVMVILNTSGCYSTWRYYRTATTPWPCTLCL